MKVLELLKEIEEIMESASSVPLTDKVLVDSGEILDLIKEIRIELPDEIEQAQWIKGDSQRIIEEAKEKYNKIIEDAERQADVMVENDDIVIKSKMRADEITRITEENCKKLKINTYNYIEDILYNFQEKMDDLNATYCMDMYEKMQTTFQTVNQTLDNNISEIKDLSYNTQMDED